MRNNLFFSWYRPGTCSEAESPPAFPTAPYTGDLVKSNPFYQAELDDFDPVTGDYGVGSKYGGAGGRFRNAFQIEEPLGADADGGPYGTLKELRFYNNIVMGSFVVDENPDFVDPKTMTEGNNIFWSFSDLVLGGYTAGGSVKVGTEPSFCVFTDFFEGTGAGVTQPSEFFMDQPDLYCSRWDVGPQNWKLSTVGGEVNSVMISGVGFGDPNETPVDCLGDVGPDGFLLPSPLRAPQYPTVGPYDYVLKLGR